MEEHIHHWIIYMYTFPNSKRYVGKTMRSLSKRQKNDFSGYESCTALWNAIQKYKPENIQQEILFEGEMPDEYAARLEKICILLFKANCRKFSNPKYGYNLTDGGDGVSGWHPDEERLEVLRAQVHEFHEQRRGTHHTESAKKKMSEAKKGKPGRPMSEENRKKLSLVNSKDTMSDKTRIRREKANEKKKKSIVATHKVTGEKIFFESCGAVAKYFNVAPSTVTRWCKNIRIPSVDYEFDYLSTNND